jgi:hypothetical protein
MHAAFLAFVLFATWLAIVFYPRLPDWLTVTVHDRGSPISAFELLFIVVMVGIHFLERRWLYVEAER